MPKFPFPTFHGENVRLWISNAEDYFDMYQVAPHLWLKISKQQFKDHAALWIQSIEPLLPSLDWPTFCRMLHERFGRDQHQIMIRRMFHIHQESTVLDYVERFSALIDQLKAYNPNIDMLYYTTRFVDGLRLDIRSVVVVQRPQTLDTAYTLALLQEEVADMMPQKEVRRDFVPYHRPQTKTALPQQPVLGADRNVKPADPVPAKTTEEKWCALRNYRRAHGLL
jgi:hypothetical protein